MRLVWVVIPLVLFGIIGVQESFADEAKVKMLDKEYVIDYRISNAVVNDVYFGGEYDDELIITIDPIAKGSISISYPYQMSGFGYVENCYADDNLFVIVDDHEIIDYKTHYGNSAQIFEVAFEKDTSEISILRGGKLMTAPQLFLKCLQQHIDTMTPSQQSGLGISPSEIICKTGLELVLKNNDSSPACVIPESAEKLIQREWAQSSKPISNCEGVDISSISDVNICGFFSWTQR
jgi:hypothetical protein